LIFSSDRLIIEHSIQFEESVLHVPKQPHADTFVLPPAKDDEHMPTLLQMRVMIQRIQMIQIPSQYSQMQSQCMQMQMQSQSRGPSGPRLLFRMQEILLGIQLILGGLDLISRSLLLHSLPLNRCHPDIFSWFSLVIPILWITKEIMSQGPQVADMECRETTWSAIPFAHMENPLTTTNGHSFADDIHHISWLSEGSGPCSMRYKSVLW
jgi:hypothetical protein